MKIQVVVPAINLWNKYTKACIESIKTTHELRILFIDNGSTDETKVEAGKLVSNVFSHHRNEQAWSCAKSWNFGIKDAWERGFDYCLVINNDVLLHPDCIDRMINKFGLAGDDIRDPKVVMVTAMDIRGDCPKPEDIFNKKWEEYTNVPESEHPNFSAFMINKKFTDTVGLFDEGFQPAYFEDNDAHRRIVLAECKAICYPPALFYHYGSRTTNEALGNGKFVVAPIQFEANRAIYIDKWGGLPGEEKFSLPFGSDAYSIKAVRQLFK